MQSLFSDSTSVAFKLQLAVQVSWHCVSVPSASSAVGRTTSSTGPKTQRLQSINLLLVTWNYTKYTSSEMWSHQLLSLVHCNLAFFVCPFTRWLLLYNCPCFRLVLVIHGFRLWTCPHIPTPTGWPHGHSAEHGQHHTAAASEQHVAVFHSRTVSVSHIPIVTPVLILHKAWRLED